MADEQIVGSPEREIHVKPIVQLEKVEISKQEDEEIELFKMRAKLYRYTLDEEEGGTWKERGVGDVKIVKHKSNASYRIIMRRDKTFTLCANHFITKDMEIKPHASSEKALVWSTPADFADEESKTETLCIRFGKPESATDFKAKFEECVNSLKNNESSSKATDNKESDKLADELSSLKVKEEKDNNNTESTEIKTVEIKDSKDTSSTQVNGKTEINGEENKE